MIFLQTNLPETLLKFLEYGIPGLSAIIIILAYNLLRAQNRRESPNESMLKTIKSFMWIALIFAVISAATTVMEKQLDSEVAAQTREKENAINSLAVATANNMAKEIAILNRNHSYSSSTGTAGKGGGGGGYGEPETINEPFISEEMSFEDYNYKKLKRAVFLSIKYCGANVEVLQNAFSILEKRGYEIEESSKTRLLKEFDELLSLRYQWLQNVAIPQAQSQLDNFPPQIQEEPYAIIPVPRELWMFSSYEQGEQPVIRIEFGEIENYRNELQLLKKQIQ